MINNERIAVVTDNPIMAAVISSGFVAQGQYVPVYEAPRMQRPDADREIVTLVNSMRRVGAQKIIYSNVDESVPDWIANYLDIPYAIFDNITELGDQAADIQEFADSMIAADAAQKLYERCASSSSPKRLAVFIVNTNEVDSVIAANYAIARNADFYTINTPDDLAGLIVERLNNISAPNVVVDVRKIDMRQLKEDLEGYLPSIDLSTYAKILFISNGIPFGITAPSVPTAHLPKLKLGISIANNLGEYVVALNQKHAFNGTILINREINTQKEEEAMSAALLRTQGLVKTKSMYHAKLSELEVEIFPYDVLYVATHGSQVVAERCTYNFRTADGKSHEIVVAVGRGTTGSVHHIESVDGVAKSSASWDRDLHGSVWVDYMENVVRKNVQLVPLKSESVLLQMRDLQFEPNQTGLGSGTAFNSLAGGNLPLVIVNACGSWNELNGNFLFAGCSAFVGTLLPVTNGIAENYAEAFFNELFNSELINVAHIAKQSLPDDYTQGLYMFCGTFESKFDFKSSRNDPNGIDVLLDRIPKQVARIEDRIKEIKDTEDERFTEAYKVQSMYLQNELDQFRNSLNSTNKK